MFESKSSIRLMNSKSFQIRKEYSTGIRDRPARVRMPFFRQFLGSITIWLAFGRWSASYLFPEAKVARAKGDSEAPASRGGGESGLVGSPIWKVALLYI